MASASFSVPIVLARVLIALVAAGALVAGFSASYRAAPTVAASTGRLTYACPMHPEVIAATKGDCPICRMALEPLKTRPESSPDKRRREPASFSLPAKAEFRAFDTASRTKVYPLSLEMRAPASAESGEVGTALFCLDESELLAPEEAGYFSPATRATSDALGIAVRVSREPPVRWDARTALVRFVTEPGALRPGETGSVKFQTRLRHGLVVRASAVVESADGPHVFVLSDDRRTAARRAVTIGNVIHGYAAIVSGLRENENVASRYAFLLDVERRALAEATP
ncbi:MAG TPA: heavy metal-binding domain-containing protein [Polyangiaceae bacterium]|nr:heavy metal-binding domain-containing protein [Polyangiaceae bacterium]